MGMTQTVDKIITPPFVKKAMPDKYTAVIENVTEPKFHD